MKLIGKFVSLIALTLALTAPHGVAQSVQTSTASPNPYKDSLQTPAKDYRLTYTITENENGKMLGTHHYSVIVLMGGRTTLKQGSKVPVATGSYNVGKEVQTQFTYLDVGLNIDSSLDAAVDGMRLRNKIEQSVVGGDKVISGVAEPVIRQTVLEGITTLTVGKPVMIGSLDIPESTRRMDIEVVLEAVK